MFPTSHFPSLMPRQLQWLQMRTTTVTWPMSHPLSPDPPPLQRQAKVHFNAFQNQHGAARTALGKLLSQVGNLPAPKESRNQVLVGNPSPQAPQSAISFVVSGLDQRWSSTTKQRRKEKVDELPHRACLTTWLRNNTARDSTCSLQPF